MRVSARRASNIAMDSRADTISTPKTRSTTRFQFQKGVLGGAPGTVSSEITSASGAGNAAPKTSSKSFRFSGLGTEPPSSHLLTAWRLTSNFSARSSWVSPNSSRACLMISAMVIYISSFQ